MQSAESLKPPPISSNVPPPPRAPPPPPPPPRPAVAGEVSDVLAPLDTSGIRFGLPQLLMVSVPYAERGKDGRPVFTIALDLDGVKWTVMRRERDVAALHAELQALLRFLPDSPLASQRTWLWKGAEQLGTLRHRVQAYLTELTCNGQWVWEESHVLRHFLQIPVTSQNRQARGVLMADIRTYQVKKQRNLLLETIKSGRAKEELSKRPKRSSGRDLGRDTFKSSLNQAWS